MIQVDEMKRRKAEVPQWSIRTATPSDAARVVEYLKDILEERQSSIADRDEMVLDIMTEREHLRRILDNPMSTVLVAVSGNRIVGFLTCECGRRRKIRHTAEIGMSVHREFRRLGIGLGLMDEVEKWARMSGTIKKLNLNVFESNVAALNLYKKMGFRIEGELKGQINLDEKYIDLILMAKDLV